VEQLLPLLPKHNEEAVGKVMHLYALLKAATLMDHAFINEAKKWGQGTSCHQHCHSQSMRNDAVNNSSSSRERRDQDLNERDLCNIIRSKDLWGRITGHRQDKDQEDWERHHERDYDMYSAYYDQPTWHCLPGWGWDSGEVIAFSCDMRKVI
jgi:hypothetical protein